VILGYVTNGFAHHTLDDALRILAGIGYRSAAITLDHHHLNPFEDDWVADARRVRSLLDDLGLRRTVETGARFLLDPARKHYPNLMCGSADDRNRRIAFLCVAIDVATEIEADSVSLWSGAADDHAGDDILFARLRAGLEDVLAHAERRGMPLSFEPEPGMYIERMAAFERLFAAIDHPLFGLTLDLGHLHCLGDGRPLDHLRRWGRCVFNVHIEDMLVGAHEHLFFGDGDMNFSEIFGELSAVDYEGPVHVELSRHSHDAPAVARAAFEFLSALRAAPQSENQP
jgi:sugar phosphate isomerase/epimerase